jgi:dihydroneopterin aldolase
VNDFRRSLDQIELRKLRADCIVGVYPSERAHPQPLLVDLALFFDSRDAARGAGLAASIDYAKLAGEVRFLLTACRFFLLEAAAEALARYVLAPPTADAPRAQVQGVTVRLSKPKALAGSALASLRIHRDASEMSYGVEEKGFGRVDRIFEDAGCGIYRLRVAPGAEIPTHVHRVMDESEMALGDGLLLQGKPVLAGSVFHWPKDFPHLWQNPRDIEQTILCVDRPSFIEDDEVVVDVPEGELRLREVISFYPRESVAP